MNVFIHTFLTILERQKCRGDRQEASIKRHRDFVCSLNEDVTFHLEKGKRPPYSLVVKVAHEAKIDPEAAQILLDQFLEW